MMTSIASLVNYYGYEETPFSLFEYFEKEEIVPNPDNFVPDWDYVYCGTNLYEKNYGCGALPVANALNSFFENSNFEVRNLYEEFDPDIYKYINYGYPVAVWCCENLTSFEDNNYTVNIRHVPYKYYSELETIAILVGYDEENVFLIFSDNSEVQKFSKEIFEKNFAECDGKAVVIIRK